MAALLKRSLPPDGRSEPRWLRWLALGIAAFVAGHVLVSAVLSRYGLEALLGGQGFDASIERAIESEVLSPGRPPAYPVFLALTRAVWGSGPSYVAATVVVQALTAWATLMGLFFVARRTTGSSAWGVLAVTLVSLNELWVVEAVRQRETFLYAAILMALVGATVYARGTPRWYPVLAGALCAAGWLTRPTGVVLFPAALFIFWKDWRASGASVGARGAVALAMSVSLPVLGWLGYQQAHFGYIAISGNDSATNLLKGNNRALTAIYPYIDVDRLSPVLLEPLQQAVVERGGDVRREYIRQAMQFISESPLEAVALVPRKLAAFFIPIYFPLGSGTASLTAAGDWQIDDYDARSIGRGDGIMALPGIVAFFLVLTVWCISSSCESYTAVGDPRNGATPTRPARWCPLVRRVACPRHGNRVKLSAFDSMKDFWH